MTKFFIGFSILFILGYQPAPILNPDPINQPIRAADTLTILRDIRYAPQPDSLLGDTSSDKLLDLYLPDLVGNKKLPVFVFVHGGGFAGGDKQSASNSALCSEIASKGFAVISINYWLTLKHHKMPGTSATANMSKGLPPAGKFNPGLQMAIQNASNDLISVFEWVNNNANKYNLDISRVAISGGSAGAMTVLYTAYVSGQNVIPIKAVVDLWGGLEDVSAVKQGAPPVLIYHGDKDKLINVEFAYALKKQMDKIGDKQSELHIMEGKGHARYDIIRKEKTDEIANFLRKTMK